MPSARHGTNRYATLISLDPVKVYVCKEGLARFCTEVYSPPDPKKGFGSEMAHLTNYSLNKTSEQFAHSNENPFSTENAASKRPISVRAARATRLTRGRQALPCPPASDLCPLWLNSVT